MKRVRFEVTAEDSALGMNSSIYECPFARAIRRHFSVNHQFGAVVGLRFVIVRPTEHERVYFTLSHNAIKHIKAFDDPKRRTPIPPGIYEMYPTTSEEAFQ